MKIVLSENKVDRLIVNYLDENYGDLNYTWGVDEYGNDTDCGAQFYMGDFSDDETFFKWYDKCWWHPESSENAQEYWEKSPMIIFENTNDYNALNYYFGERWKSVFIDWFNKNYNLELKTIE